MAFVRRYRVSLVLLVLLGVVVALGALGRVHERAETPRFGARRRGRSGRQDPASPDPDDEPGHRVRIDADGARLARRGRGQRAAGQAVIGGLMVSSGLTPILIPTLYTIFEERFPRHLALEEEGAA